jgi:hypothetical protein
MNMAQKEAASTCCTDKDKGFSLGNFNLKDNWIWLVVVVVIFCCCSGGSKGGFFAIGNNCCRPKKCGNGSGGTLGNYWVLILLVVLCACSGGGLGGNGLLGNQGNTNTNVINVAANEGYEESDDYCC